MSSRHGPLRRAALVGVVVAGLVLALSAPGVALGAQVPKLPSTITPSVMAVSATGPVAIPVQGADRVATAIEAAKKFGTAANVVLATGADFPDALGGSALAGAVDGPILLTGGVALEPAVLAEIETLGATKVYILGGTGAVSAAVEASLVAEGLSVERVSGANRYATAKAVADKTIELLGGSYTGGAFIATGLGYADALAAAPIMYAKGMPLVLVDGAGNYTLSPAMTSVDILGGTGPVPASVETALGTKKGTRLAGATRYETAIKVAEYGVSKGMGWNNLGIATGESFPDALCAGPLLGKNGSVLLMTTTASLTGSTETKLEALAGSVDQYFLFGGTGAIATGTRTAIQTALTPAADTDRHRLPTNFCTTGCHGTGTDVTGDGAWRIDDIHAGLAVGGCGSCHPPFSGATRECATCHPTAHSGAHPAVASTSTESCTQAGCHAGDVVTVHELAGDCTVCHNATTVLTDATCETCHGATEVKHATVAAHTVANTGGGCFDAYCHGTDVTKMHGIDFRASGEEPPGCSACHNDTVTPSTTCLGACHSTSGFGVWHNDAAGHAALVTSIEDISAGCVACHGSDLLAIERVDGEHKGCSCHAYGHAAGADSCESCHNGTHAPHVSPDPHDALDFTKSEDDEICLSCHGDATRPNGVNVNAVASREVDGGEVFVPADPTHAVQEHVGCSCHAHYGPEVIRPGVGEQRYCVDCHAVHGFQQKVQSWNPTGTWAPAGGHNTTLFDVKGATEVFGAAGVVVKDSMGATIEQEWPLPTASVFWSQSNAVKQYLDPTFETTASVAATDSPLVAMDFRGFATPQEGVDALRLDVGWDSLITCYDCHTELEGLAGPQGANAANYGLDPNFPDDWTKAELTSWDPTGMRSIETTNGGTNPYYTTIGSNIHTPDDGVSLAKVNIIYNDPSTATTVAPGAFYNIGVPASQGYSMGNTDPKRFICQKCHKLTNSFQGQGIEGNGRGNRSNAMNYMGFSNYPHMEHHGDQIQGQGNCVSCHVAIPHGWKRPRLLVSERDPEPYKVQWVYAGYRDLTAAKDPNADLSEGNWGYIGPGSSNTLYKDLTALNPDSPAEGKYYSSHLEKVSASPNAHKALEAIPQEHFLHGQHDNHAADLVYEAYGFEPLKWDTWDYTTNGVNWHADTSNDRGHYNNCSACTSAGNRHDDSVAGVAPDVPYWK